MLTSLWKGFKKFKYINTNCNHGDANDIGNSFIKSQLQTWYFMYITSCKPYANSMKQTDIVITALGIRQLRHK